MYLYSPHHISLHGRERENFYFYYDKFLFQKFLSHLYLIQHWTSNTHNILFPAGPTNTKIALQSLNCNLQNMLPQIWSLSGETWWCNAILMWQKPWPVFMSGSWYCDFRILTNTFNRGRKISQALKIYLTMDRICSIDLGR